MRARRLEHAQRARDVGFDERFGAADRAIDVALGGKVRDHVDGFGRQQFLDQRAIEDRALDEAEARVAMRRREVGEIAGIGQRVEHDDPLGVAGEQMRDKIGADEASAARDQNTHAQRISRLRVRRKDRTPRRS